MLVGTADPNLLAQGAPKLADFAAEPLTLEGVETLQILSEIEREGADALLPPGLHPTLPPIATWLVQRVPGSPWGPFHLAQCRIECRSGLRPRGFLRAGVIDNPAAAAELGTRWGYRLAPGEIRLGRGYDRIEASVSLGGASILEVALEDPMPLRPEDAYTVSNMHLAHTPRGLRLLQVDPEFEVERAERGRPLIRRFEACAWRSQGVQPSSPVSALFTLARMTIPRIRYACRPEVLAFEGTERVDA
jgi:hypothetical protein